MEAVDDRSRSASGDSTAPATRQFFSPASASSELTVARVEGARFFGWHHRPANSRAIAVLATSCDSLKTGAAAGSGVASAAWWVCDTVAPPPPPLEFEFLLLCTRHLSQFSCLICSKRGARASLERVEARARRRNAFWVSRTFAGGLNSGIPRGVRPINGPHVILFLERHSHWDFGSNWLRNHFRKSKTVVTAPLAATIRRDALSKTMTPLEPNIG